MGKSKKAALVAIGKKKRVVEPPPSTESEGEDSSTGSPGSVRSGKGGRNGTIRHVYTTNSDMECIEEYLKPIYKDGEVILDVECGSNKAMMYLSKLCQGSKGPCVEFQGSWLTPNEFQYVSGRETAKDWKRSIRHQGKSMKLLLTKGVLSVHSTVCDCDGCRLTSPVNRCRLAEKRKSVYSTNRKERLTLESFTSCDTSSLSETPDIYDKTQEENHELTETYTTDITNSKEETQPKKLSSKNCSPLRESRLSNIIEQLRTSKEKETLSDTNGLTKDVCDEVNQVCDENGNEGNVDSAMEMEEYTAGKEAGLVCEELTKDDSPVRESVSETVPSKELPESSVDLSPEIQSKEEDKPDTDEVENVKEDETFTETAVISESVPEKNNTDELGSKGEENNTGEEAAEVEEHSEGEERSNVEECNKSEAKSKVEGYNRGEEGPKEEEQKSSQVESEDINSEEKQIDVIDNDDSKIKKMDTETAVVETKSEIPVHNTTDLNTLSFAPTHVKQIDIEKDTVVNLKQDFQKATESRKMHKKDQLESSHSDKKLSEYKPQQLSPPYISRKEKREEKETKSKSLLGKKSSPAAPTQDYPPSMSCLTALPASVPEQLFAGDIPGAKYSDFIRLLAASHLGGHIPLAPDRLIGDNLQAFPLASNFNGLPHPFPAYPFFPHQLPMKEASPFQVPHMSMPPPFLPPYMYRPFGLLPQTMLDPAKYAQLHSVPEAFRPTPGDSAADAPRKRLSDSDSALDLSTKRFKFDDRLVSSSGSTYQLPRKSSSQTASYQREKTQSASRHDRDRTSSSYRSGGKAREMTASDAKVELSSERKSNSRRECSCLSSRKDDIRLWSVTEVGQFLKTLDGCSVYADTFREHRVDGKSLPLLTVEHLMQNIGMKLGPAVLLTKTVAKRLKVSKHAHRKCQKCDSKLSGLKSPITTCNMGMGRVF